MRLQCENFKCLEKSSVSGMFEVWDFDYNYNTKIKI